MLPDNDTGIVEFGNNRRWGIAIGPRHCDKASSLRAAGEAIHIIDCHVAPLLAMTCVELCRLLPRNDGRGEV